MAREVPQYISQLNVGSMPKIQYSMAGAEATQQASAQLSVLAQDVNKKATELQDLRTETAYKENLNRIYNENRANPEGFNKSYDGFYKEFRGKLPNTEFTQKLDIQHQLFSQSYRDRVMEQYSSNVDEDHKFEQDKTLLINNGMRAELAKDLLSDIPEVAQSAAQKTQLLDEQDDAIYSTKNWDGSNRWSDEARTKGVVNRATTMFKALPATKRLEATGAVPADFMDVMGPIWQSEVRADNPDAVTPDGDGSVAKYGINSRHNKGVDVANLTPEGALKIYKEKYWDGYKIGELPANVRGVVMDGMVNGAPKELLERARAGASVAELIDIRQNYYDKISPGKDKAVVTSWNNRLNKYRHMILSDAKKYIDPDTIESLDKEARAEIQTEMTMWREDPAKAAMLKGARTVEDIVKPQLARNVPKQYARVLDNQAAETMAQRINQSQNTDDVVKVVSELQQTYGEFTPNAISDLKEKGKMKPEMEGALSLAAAGNPAYKEHIDLLTQAGAAGETAINEVFAVNQYSAKDLSAKLSAETEDWQKAILNEGKSPKEMQEKLQVATSLAKAKMNKALDGRYGDAVEFAMKPEQDMYAIRDLRGDTYRIPTKFTADDVEDGLEIAMKDKLPKLVAGSADENYVYSNTVSPFLSPLEDGLMFRTPMGEVVADKSGKPIEFKFQELVGTKKVRPLNTYKPIPKGGM